MVHPRDMARGVVVVKGYVSALFDECSSVINN